MDVTQGITWLQKHERIVIAVLILASVLALGNKYINYAAQSAASKATVAAQQLANVKSSNEALVKQNEQFAANYNQLFNTLTQQNAVLASAVTNRNTQLTKQQQTNNTLPLPDLALRWKSVAGLQDSDIAATATGIGVTDTGARKTVNELEKVPVLEQNVRDIQTVADNRQTLISKANELNTGLTKEITGLNVQIVDQTVACKTELTAVKAQAAKDKRKWFVRGFVTGYIAGLVTKFVKP